MDKKTGLVGLSINTRSLLRMALEADLQRYIEAKRGGKADKDYDKLILETKARIKVLK